MVSRSYRSPRRADSAAETRAAILHAAATLYQEKGYQSASVAEIAESAGVSVNTIYASIGNKPQLLIALIEAAAGSDAVDDTLERVEAATTLGAIMGVVSRGTRTVFEANVWVLGALYDNAATDPRIAEVMQASENQYKARLSVVAERLHSQKLVRASFGKREIADILWFYFGFRPWRDTRDLGWSWDRAEEWLSDQAAAALG
jgi:AcrR family transcriptional regulator